jgi:hypothetical protein
MFITVAGNPGKHVRTVDIPEPVTRPVPVKLPPVQAPASPARERELVPTR